MELKVLALQNRKLIHNFYKLEDIVFDSRNGNFDTENYFKKDVESLALEEHKHIDIAFQQWEKVREKLFDGTVPSNNFFLDGSILPSVPSNNFFIDGTVP